MTPSSLDTTPDRPPYDGAFEAEPSSAVGAAERHLVAAPGTDAPKATRERIATHEPKATRGRVLSVHLGESANCSSLGSFVDVLFVSSVAATALLGAVIAALGAQSDDDSPPPDTPPRNPSSPRSPEEH